MISGQERVAIRLVPLRIGDQAIAAAYGVKIVEVAKVRDSLRKAAAKVEAARLKRIDRQMRG